MCSLNKLLWSVLVTMRYDNDAYIICAPFKSCAVPHMPSRCVVIGAASAFLIACCQRGW
jgi:hypothetical protein